MTAPLAAAEATLSYDDRVIAENLTVEIPDEEFTVIVGPNACGKSTLLRALARLHKPATGRILLDGSDIHSLNTRTIARRVGLLPQHAVAPEKMLVRELVARGRSPHQGMFRQWSAEDHEAVMRAMELAAVSDLAERDVDELSGGQRQRVWIALVLAQNTPLILLDEPTTFLDISHQIEILELCRMLHREENRTIVAVLHDLNLACRYATHLIAMRDGQVHAEGASAEIITEQTVHDIFGLNSMVVPDPVTGTPLVVPLEGNSARRTTTP